MLHPNRYILTLSCADVRGIVAAVTGFLAARGGFILELAQYGDEQTEHFFMRVDFALDAGAPDIVSLRHAFGQNIATGFGMRWQIVEKAARMRTLVMVSRHGHCLNDLLYRRSAGQLPIEICGIVSNHTDFEPLARWHGVPFTHLPVDAQSKPAQEEALLALIEESGVELVVLARYMQVLSADLCKALEGRAINIHHSFLPSFKGAKPYVQAHERGVKIIGATAHYVTADLDEGPIIEQEVARVDHTRTADELAAIGRDVECNVLARAVRYHSEHRVFINGRKTVVFT
jgi:formyltetrahydrofolate deformylase